MLDFLLLFLATSPIVLYVSLVISLSHFRNCSSVYWMPESLRTSLVPQPDDTVPAIMPSVGQKSVASVTLVDGHTITSAPTTYCAVNPIIHLAVEVTDEIEDHREADSKKKSSSEKSQHLRCANINRKCTCKASIERVPILRQGSNA
ncbi:hypothetical protein V1523DRAFT_402911 [Lipomyces doorenjongii]